MRMKLDLRVLCTASNNANKQDDLSSGEFAKASTFWKFYKDKTKLVLHGKLLLNEMIRKLGNNGDTRVCMLQSMGLEAEIYSLRLFANGLYVLESHGILKIPTAIDDYASSMKTLLEKLAMFKALSLKMKSSCDRSRTKKYHDNTSLSRFTTADDEHTPSSSKWTRDIWYASSLPMACDDDDE